MVGLPRKGAAHHESSAAHKPWNANRSSHNNNKSHSIASSILPWKRRKNKENLPPVGERPPPPVSPVSVTENPLLSPPGDGSVLLGPSPDSEILLLPADQSETDLFPDVGNATDHEQVETSPELIVSEIQSPQQIHPTHESLFIDLAASAVAIPRTTTGRVISHVAVVSPDVDHKKEDAFTGRTDTVTAPPTNMQIRGDTTPAATLAAWEIPRWKELQAKRIQLCQQRVRLEQRLFEYTMDHGQKKMEDASSSSNDLHEVATMKVMPMAFSSSLSSLDLNHVPAPLRGGQHPTTLLWDEKKEEEISTAMDKDVAAVSSPHINATTSSSQVTDGRSFVRNPGSAALVWKGPWDEYNQCPVGWGRMFFPDGQEYQGFVVAGQRDGPGCNKWPNGQVYNGRWKDDQRNGRGTHTWPDGRKVTGEWKEGHLNGRIFYSWPDGATYDGDALHGKKDGRGTHTWSDGRVYVGQYEAGMEHGYGTLTDKDESKYRGEFRHGKRHGYGVQFWRDKTYDGEWQANMVHGRGKLSWNNGACYTGEFHKGRYHGSGCFQETNGRRFDGRWVHGHKEGKGRETWTHGRVFVGSYRRGRKHGFGHMTYANGSQYYGEWHQGKRSGLGLFLSITGKVEHVGFWSQGQPVRLSSPSRFVQDDATIRYHDARHQVLADAYLSKSTAAWYSRCRDDSHVKSSKRSNWIPLLNMHKTAL